MTLHVKPSPLSRCWRFGLRRRRQQSQTHYVDVFDLSRKHSLYLSYWTDGDTRRRSEVLAAFKQRYRRSGFLVHTGGELPDYLPMVLEYAAIVDPVDGTALLQKYRSSVELLRLALEECGTPYAGVLTAVCSTLPGPSPANRKAVMAMAAAGPPTETVGLEPYGTPLLPMGGSR
jgi:nitrate reductase molybdenum cofactor assembly chaperone NarJ/NarW